MKLGVATIIGFSLFVAFEMLPGISFNIFILIHIFLDFLRSNSIGPRDKILVALCVSSLCYMTMITVNLLIELLSSLVSNSYSLLCFLYVLLMYSITSCSWLTACLCFFYCIKIINFKSRLLVQLQMNINTVVPWLILVVEMISLCGSVCYVQLLLLPVKQSPDLSNNSTDMMAEEPIYIYINSTVHFVSFLIVMVTAMSTVASLILHIRRMKKRLETTECTGMAAHHGALRTVLGLLCLYTTFYIAIILITLLDYHSLSYWIFRIIMFSFSPAQAAILIQGNPKLWGSVLRVAARLSCIRKPDSPM